MMKILYTVFFISIGLSQSFAQSVGDFRSRQTGDWTDSNTWEELVSIGPEVWSNTANTPSSADGVIDILSFHEVTILNTSNISADQVIVRGDAYLYVNGTLNIMAGFAIDLEIATGDPFFGGSDGFVVVGVDGILNNAGEIESATSANLTFNSNSFYNHNRNSGSIPISTWNTGSNCVIKGSSQIVGNLNQSFYNFEWNNPTQSGSTIIFAGALSTVNGDLTFRNTNNKLIVLGQNAATIGATNVQGNFTVLNSSLVAISFSDNFTLDVSGDVIINSTGILYLTATGTGVLNVFGSFTKSNTGAVNFNLPSNANGNGTLNLFNSFNTSGGSYTKNLSATGLISFKGGGITQSYQNSGSTFTNGINFNVANSSYLNLGTNNISGTGNFTLNSGSSLAIGNIDGIVSNTISGALRVPVLNRNFANGSTLIYNGSASQSLGSGFPSTEVNLVINNSGPVGNNNVNLSDNLSIARTLTLTDGSLNIGNGNTLTLNGSVITTAGGISGGSLSNLSIGGSGAFGTLGFVGTNSLNDFTISRTSTGSVTLGNDLTVLGTFTQTFGNLNLNGNTLTLSGPYSRNAGSLIPDATSSIVINGAGALPATFPLTGTMQSITMDRAATTFNTGAFDVVVSNLNALSGTLDYSLGSFDIADGGTVERQASATFNTALTSPGSFDLTYNNDTDISSGGELPTNTTALNSLTKTGGAVLTLNSGVTINGNLTLSNGNFNAGANTVSLNGNFIDNAASTLTSATIIFDGITTLSGSNNPTFGNITINGSFSPTIALTVNGDITNNGTFSNSAGTLTINAASQLAGTNPIAVNNFTIGASGVVTASATAALEIDGAFANNGSFDANGGTVIFGGTTSISGTIPDFHTVQIEGVLNAPTTLVVAGNFTNNNIFNNNNGIVQFSGAGTKNITGLATSSFYDLELTAGSLNVNSNADINSLLTLGASTSLDADGSGSGVLTFKSTETLDGSLAALASGASISGEVTVERYLYTLRGDNQGYHMMGFPLTNVSIAEIQADGFSITGAFSGASTGTAQGDGFASIFAYDETAGTTFADGYAAFPGGGGSDASTFTPGEGYYVFSYLGDAPLTLDGRGSLLTGNQTFPLSYSNVGLATDNGWHMVSNPYASAVSWGNVTKTNLASSNSAYVWNPLGGAYETLIDNVASEIRQGQAVFVQAATGGGSVTFEEADKVNSSSAIFYREAAPENEYYMISLFNGTYEDKAYITYRDEATDAYELKYDAARLINSYETFSLLSTDSKKLKINALAKSTVSECIRSTFFSLEQVVTNRNYELRLGGLANDSFNSYELVDHFLDKTVLISDQLTYTFTVTNNAASKGSSRFELIINKKSPLAVNVETINACEGNTAYVKLSNTQAGISYMLVSQDSVYGQFVGTEDSPNIEFSIEGLNAGDNEFSVEAFSANCDTVLSNNINLIITPTIDENIEVLGSEICPSEPTASYSISTQKNVMYYVLQANDTIKSLSGDGTILFNSIEAAYLSAGENVFQVVADNGICDAVTLNQSIKITVEDLTINESITYYGSSVCSGEQASVTINAQDAVSYSFKIGAKEVATVVGDGTEKTVNIPSNYLTQGENNIFIHASFGNCKQFEYLEPANITLENVVNTILEVNTQDLCELQSTEVEIANVQVGNVYRLLSGGVLIASAVANMEGNISIAVVKEALEIGLNTFDISITNEICGTFQSENQASIFVSETLSIGQISALQACKGEVVTVDIPIEQEFVKIALFNNGQLVRESTTGSFTIVADSSTSFEVIAYNETNCNSISQVFTLAVSEIGSIEIIQEEQLLKASIEADSYQWYLNNELLEGETNRLLIANESGSYLVSAKNGVCENSSEAVNINVEQILATENPLDTYLKLYPNPIEGELQIDLTGYSTKNYKVTIFTTEGKFINSYNFTDTISTINLETYKTGVYLLRLETEKGVITKRVVKK